MLGALSRTARITLLLLSTVYAVELDSGLFHRSTALHSWYNLRYRFYRNQPSLYDISTVVNIPFRWMLTDPDLPGYSLMSSFGYTFSRGAADLHRYFFSQNWYGDFLHAGSGYAFTHRSNPISAILHEWPITLGGYYANWEFTLIGELRWGSDDFRSLWGGRIAYLFHTQPPGPFSRRNPIAHRAELWVYQTGPSAFGVRNSYHVTLVESPFTRLHLSWEIFPIRIGVALVFAWEDLIQVVSHTLYQPEWGFDPSFEVGIKNFRFSEYRWGVEPSAPDNGASGNAP